MALEFIEGDVVASVGRPNKWVVVDCKSSPETYFACEIVNGKRWANALFQLTPGFVKKLVKVGKWSFMRNCEVEDET